MADPAAFSCADILAARPAIRGIADGMPFVPSRFLAGRRPGDITIRDLAGPAAQDTAIATHTHGRHGSAGTLIRA